MSLATTFSTALAWLGTYLVHSTVLLAFAWFATRPARRPSPRFVERAWRVGVLGPLLTATAATVFPATPLLGVVAFEARSVTGPIAPSRAAAAEAPGGRGADEPTWLARVGTEDRSTKRGPAARSTSPVYGEAEVPLDPGRSVLGVTAARREGLRRGSARPTRPAADALPRGARDDPHARSPVDDPNVPHVERSAARPIRLPSVGALTDRASTAGASTGGAPRPIDGVRPLGHAASGSVPSARASRRTADRGSSTATEEERAGAAEPGPAPTQRTPVRAGADEPPTATISATTSAPPGPDRADAGIAAAPLDGPAAPASRPTGQASPHASEPDAMGVAARALRDVRWSELLLLLWTGPALVLATTLLLGALRLGWDLRRRRPVREAAICARFDAIRRRAGLPRPVRLTTAPHLSGPITFGVLRPEVALPERALEGLRPAHQRAMFAHELAHVVRRDPLWFAGLAALERVLCFQPLLRLARRRLVEVAEERADDLAVRWTEDRVALAGCLAEIARWIVEARRRSPLPVAGMASSRLGHRIERLLVADPAPEPRQRWFPAVALALLVTTAGAAPSVRSGTGVGGPTTTPDAPSPPSAATPGAEDVDAPVDGPIEGPVDAPVEGPDDAPDDAPVDAPVEGPGDPGTDPSAVPSAADVPSPAVLVPAVPVDALLEEFARLDEELALLSAEMVALRGDLGTYATATSGVVLSGLDARLTRLQDMRDRAGVLLLEALSAPPVAPDDAQSSLPASPR